MPAPKITLVGPQLEVVRHREGHLQVIACAGSGKTESVSQRVAALIEEGASPESIVAFTFTERAAAELKDRIVHRVVQVMGEDFKGRLAQMFVGTIHSYCFKLLQDHVPKYGDYDVLEPNRHAGLLSRECERLGLKTLVPQHWAAIEDFSNTVDVIGNELITPEQLGATPLGKIYREYLATLDRYHFLTFALIIQKAVEVLNDPAVFARVRRSLRHLIVDEYQDINPAQEALIRRLGASPVQVCVVGDDDQSIYQWRGSQTENILTFVKRYKAKSITLEVNRRSSSEIVVHADAFAQLIPNRLAKKMKPHRPSSPKSVVAWLGEDPEAEAETVADAIAALHDRGFRYRDIALLFRSVRTSAGPFINALRARHIPISCGGRTGLFMLPEISVLGRMYIWFVDDTWRPPGYGQQPVAVTIDDLVSDYRDAFDQAPSAASLRKYLNDWKATVEQEDSRVNLIGDYYRFLNLLKVHELDPEVADHSARLGSLARFSNILADFENVTRRARWVAGDSGTRAFTGGTDRGKHYYRRLANFMQHYARDAYEDFEGESHASQDAVDIVTVHQAKGLEWQVVFMPSLSARRFPSAKAGQSRQWLLSEKVLPAPVRRRYEGGIDEERRLFYVAMTRARDVLYTSCFQKQAKRTPLSPFLTEAFGNKLPVLTTLPLLSAPAEVKPDEKQRVIASFSELSDYQDCGFRYRLGNSLGFETQLVSELGYGRAIHNVLRHIAESARTTGKVPSAAEVRKLMDAQFYLPFANKANFKNMRAAADRLIDKYLNQYREDLKRIWATERPFEMHLPEGTLSGRADVILSHHNGKPDSLAIVDYKTADDPALDAVFGFQLAVYTAAGRGEGLSVDAALLHSLGTGMRTNVDVSPAATNLAVGKVRNLLQGMQASKFTPNPDHKRCGACEYRGLCKHASKSEVRR
jgi:DNA helicase-2/ATP-dependent DNA helicase PcrA